MSNEHNPKYIYLDNNATTPLAEKVLEVLQLSSRELYGNPSSIHQAGQKAAQQLALARRRIADCLQVTSKEIIFTSGGTEALNMLLMGLIDPSKPAHLITSNCEHAATLSCCKRLETLGWEVTYLPAGTYGAVTTDALKAAIRPNTALISLIAVNNETGVLADLNALAACAEEHRIPLLIDGVAWLGKVKPVIPRGVTAMAFSAHKLHGPKGEGFALVRSSAKVRPLILGGGQERTLRSGTPNVPGILAMAEAIELACKDIEKHMVKMEALRSRFERSLKEQCKGVLINGEGPRVCNLSNVAFEGANGESLLIALDLEGVAASHGSACSSGALELSKVLLAMGYSYERVRGSIRFSFSRFNTEEEIDRAVEIISKLTDVGHSKSLNLG